MLDDLRFGWRILRKHPGSTAVACLSLALGIGASTAMFSVIHAVLLDPFPYRDADRIVGFSVIPVKSGPRRGLHLPAEYLDIRQQNHVFEDVIANGYEDLTLTGGREPESLSAATVSTNTFRFLGVAPLLGRWIVDSDEGQQVVVLDFKTWNRRFGANRAALGQTLELNGAKYTIVGVMPSRFGWRGPDLWIPLVLDRASSKFVSIRARLRAGVTTAVASEELRAIHQRLAPSYAKYYPRDGFAIEVYSLRDGVIREFRTTLYILFAAVLMLLLIACVNVANIQLAWATERHREMAIRCAAGASRFRLARLLLTESLLLSVTGAIGGVILAFTWTSALVALMPPFGIPNEARIAVNKEVLLFSALLAIATGILSGLAPALSSSRFEPAEVLKSGGRGAGQARAGARIRAGLVAAEMALALILLVGAGLMLRSFAAYRSVDLGFRPENLLTLRIPLSPARYTRPDQRSLFYQNLLGRLSLLPAIEAVTVSNAVPPWSNAATDFEIEGHASQEQLRANAYFVGRTYFRVLGATLLRGELFGEQDELRGECKAVVSDFLAGRYFPGEDPLGKRIHLRLLQNAGRDPWCTITGVVSTMKNNGVQDDPRPAVYVPYTVLPGTVRVVLARTSGEPLALGAAVRARVTDVDKDQVVSEISTVEQELKGDEARPRFSVVLTTSFAFAGLLLSAMGIYSVVSYTISRRVQEIGVRMALGAEPPQIITMVVAAGLRLAMWGILFGGIGAWSLTRLITHLLFRVSPADPASFAVASLLLAMVAVAACYIPARRAARTDPQQALRCE